jgi:hypothetical protein
VSSLALKGICFLTLLGSRRIALPSASSEGFKVLRQKPTAASFRRAVEHAKELGVDLHHNGAKVAYFNTAVISQKKLDCVTNRLRIFARAFLKGRLSWCFD